MTTGMEPYLALLLLGFLPSEMWRWIGLLIGRGLDEESEIILWVRAVATALVAAVVARLVLIPPGALASVPLWVRLLALGGGVVAFYGIRRSAFAGVLVGEAILVIGMMAFGG
jgi:hypothetical protein